MVSLVVSFAGRPAPQTATFPACQCGTNSSESTHRPPQSCPRLTTACCRNTQARTCRQPACGSRTVSARLAHREVTAQISWTTKDQLRRWKHAAVLYAENLIHVQVFGKHRATTAPTPPPTVLKLSVWLKDKMPRAETTDPVHHVTSTSCENVCMT
jgi:hypothetical protein